MRSSKYYQRWLQLVSCGSAICLFFSAYFLGKERFAVALILLIVQVGSRYAVSELMYMRQHATIREGVKEGADVLQD